MSLLLTPGFGEFMLNTTIAEESIVAVKPINLTHVEAALPLAEEPPGIAL